MESHILEKVREELKTEIDEEYKNNIQRFFIEKIVCYGIRTPTVHKVAKKYIEQIKLLDKKELFDLADELFRSGYNEEAIIAIRWVSEVSKEFGKNDFDIFESWLKKYINNWMKVDYFCLYIIHPMIDKYPDLIEKVKKWSYSENAW